MSPESENNRKYEMVRVPSVFGETPQHVDAAGAFNLQVHHRR